MPDPLPIGVHVLSGKQRTVGAILLAPPKITPCSTCFENAMSRSAGDADRFERKPSIATELSWKKRAEHSLSDLVLSFMNAGLMHLGVVGGMGSATAHVVVACCLGQIHIQSGAAGFDTGMALICI